MILKKINLNDEKWLYTALASSLIIFAVFSRLLPHPPNFTPIAAVAIFGATVLPRRFALSLPIIAMIISDLIIGLHPLILFTWGSFAAIAFLSHRYLKKIRPITIVGAGICSSVLFYIVTNFGVWLQGQMYPMTYAGLLNCYYKAIPFFRNTLLGDILYASVLFGLYSMVGILIAKRFKQINISTK